jgi:hypothetical protein
VEGVGGNVRNASLLHFLINERYAANMKVITSIYLNCRPDLRDEWLTGNEVDDVSDAQVRNSSIVVP